MAWGISATDELGSWLASLGEEQKLSVNFDDLIGDLTAAERARVEVLKDEARAETVTYNLKELRRHRQLTQTELAERLDRAQASVSAMETAADNLVSTLRTAVEGMGGRLEVAAVFDDERIPLTTHARAARQEQHESLDTLTSVIRAASTEMMRRFSDPGHADEQREARRLLAGLAQSLEELQDADMPGLAGRDAETEDAERASSRPAHSA